MAARSRLALQPPHEGKPLKLPIPNRLVDALVRHAKRNPYRHLDGYMERYWLLRTRWLSCRLHVILASDDDRALHDHPWNYATVVLRGGYTEVTPDPVISGLTWACHLPEGQRREWIAPGRVLFRRAESLHRLEVPRGQTCLTLFFTGRKRRSWGFQTPQGWLHHRDYVARIEDGTVPHSWRGAARA